MRPYRRSTGLRVRTGLRRGIRHSARDRVAIVELLVVAEFPGFLWVPEVLGVQGFLEALEALEALAQVLSFHLVLINLHSKEVLHHSWVLSLDLR